jgi:hypothetical protein
MTALAASRLWELGDKLSGVLGQRRYTPSNENGAGDGNRTQVVPAFLLAATQDRFLNVDTYANTPSVHDTQLTMSVEILLKSLSHLIYASSAESKMSDAELRTILARARSVNSQLDITGILLHIEGDYFQVLEGDAEAIDSLYAKIAHDRRHKNVVLIVREPIASRSFADWSMGFASVTSKDVEGIIGANDFFQKRSCFYELSAGRAKKLLAAFADGRWRASSAA